MSDKKPSITAVIIGITMVISLFGGIIAFDSRYIKTADLESTKNEIIGEMRREVVKNRGVMIDTMQREADDIEFTMSELTRKKKEIPRYLLEKHKQIIRQIEELKNAKDK